MITDKERVQRSQDHRWNLALMEGFPDKKAYASIASMRRAFIHRDATLAVWCVRNGQIQVLNRYQVLDIHASARDGFHAQVFDEQNKCQITVGHLPTRLPGTDCFLWIPRHADARYVPANLDNPTGRYRLTLSAMFGSGIPLKLREGEHCLTYLKDLPIVDHQVQQGEVVHA